MSNNKIEEAALETDLKKAVLFELENTVIEGRKIVYDVLRNILVDKGVDVTSGLFSKYCLSSHPSQYVPVFVDLAGKKRLSIDKLVVEIEEGIRLSILDANAKLRPGIKNMLSQFMGKGVDVGALTCLSEETATQLMKKVGIKAVDSNVLAHCCGSKNEPTPDAWLKLAKKMEVSPFACLAICTTASSSKAALSAGMKCIAMPDDFTGFQDFGGVDYVLSEIDTDTFNELYTLMDIN